MQRRRLFVPPSFEKDAEGLLLIQKDAKDLTYWFCTTHDAMIYWCCLEVLKPLHLFHRWIKLNIFIIRYALVSGDFDYIDIA